MTVSELVRVLQGYGAKCCSEHGNILTARGIKLGALVADDVLLLESD